MEGHHVIVQKFEVLIQPDVLDNITIARISVNPSMHASL